MELTEEKEKPIEILLANVNGRLLGKLIETKVMVSKVGELGAEIYAKRWKCASCSQTKDCSMSEEGVRCPDCRKSMQVKEELKRDFKEIEVEEMLTTMDRQPERKRVKITGKLLLTKKVEFIQPGDVINLEGYIQEEKTKQKMDRIILNYYILADSIEHTSEEDDDTLNEKEIEQIKEIAKDKPIEKLRDSLAPNIYDYDKIKTSLLLQMVRGPENMANTRPTINILMCGMASTAKSKLAQAVHEKTPKSIYGSGENMSKAGLIAIAEKDELSGRWGIRAGMFARANMSMVVIDEMDKLSKEDRDGLQTPMEMGKILFDKAGIHCEMASSTSVLGCCNPKNGRFDLRHMDSIQSQINMPEPLLTRFDLIYILKDNVDKDRDEKIFRSLLATKKTNAPVSDKLFKKYIKYASKIEPVFDEEATDTFVEIANNWRQEYEKRANKEETSPFSFRESGGLIRLAVASAKLRLSNKVELCDLKLAESLMLDALESMGFGRDFNSVEYAALYGGTTSKKMALQDKIKQEIKNQIFNNNRDDDKIKKTLVDMKLPEKEVNKVFSQLRQEGTIFGRYDNCGWNNG